MQRLKILILGGTTEASALARLVAGDPRFDPVLSLAGRTKAPQTPPIAYRVGGFGGVAGLARHLREEDIDALVDATHPFAAQISAHAVAAARETEVPLLAICRPAWQVGPGDRWTNVPDIAAAASALGTAPRRVFLTIGQKDLAPFRGAPQHYYVIRSVDAPDPAAVPPQAEIIAARGPFVEVDERRLLAEKRIDVVVTKNSGGAATEAKLAAARSLGIPVILVDRRPPLDVPTVTTAAEALLWLEQRHRATVRSERGV